MARRPIRHTDTGLGWVNRKFGDIERQIREMRAERRLGQSEVPEGGDLRVRGTLSVLGQALVTGLMDLTGDMLVRNNAGQTIFRIGDMDYGRGIEFTRDDGTQAFGVKYAYDTSSVQTWEWRDRNGKVILSEDEFGAGGLSRPRLVHPFQPYAATTGTAAPTFGPYGWERDTTSDTWETLFIHEGRKQNTFLDLKFAAMCSDATTSGEVRAVDHETGNQLATFPGVPWEADIPAGTTTLTVVDPQPLAAVMPGSTNDYAAVGVQVRRTAGAGSIRLAVPIGIGG